MRILILLPFVAVLALPAGAVQQATSITVDELQQVLPASEEAHQADADLARQLLGMELTERLSTPRLARLKVGLPGEKAEQALAILADISAFLAPPAGEILTNPTPDPPTLHRLLASVVNYVNTSLRQLPNFIATRDTTRFEDRPLEDIQGSLGMTTMIYLPLHLVGRSNVSVTYRDGHEVVEKIAEKTKRGESQEKGLFTEGVFGPILSTVVGDALKGQITWSRWEAGADGREAVFHFVVPREQSHYSVAFCCVPGSFAVETHEPGGSPGSGTPEPKDWHVFAETAAYHGELAFNPVSGAILRITLDADMPPHEAVTRNGIMVEYGAVDIGGQTYICPLRGVSTLMAHLTQPLPGLRPSEAYKGPVKTFLNDAVFEQYHLFRSEVRIVAADHEEPAANPPAEVAAAAVATSSHPVPTDSPKTTEDSAAALTVDKAAEMPTTAPSPAASATLPVSVAAPEQEISIGAVANDQPTALVQPSGYTLKMTTRLVDVSLVAVDKKGHPVSGLKAEDVEVFDNGRKQAIKFFSPVDAILPAASNAPVASEENTFSNRAVDAAAGSTAAPPSLPHSGAGATILLLDESHIAWNDMNNARAQMLQFLAAAPLDERIGLYTMNSFGFHVLAEATTDHLTVSERLRKWMPTSQSVAQAQGEETRNRQHFEEVMHGADLNSVNGNQAVFMDGLQPVDPQLLTMGSNPARASLIILVGVARRLAVVPGHKNLVWVSSDNVFADWNNQEVGTDRKVGFLDGFSLRTQEAMNDAHVAVYPFDVSQLETASIAADTQHRNVMLNPTNPGAGSVPTDYAGGRIKAEMLQDIHPIQWPVRQVAEATGGRTIRRSGDLAAALAQIVEDGHGSYLLSFSPDQPADGEYHSITVKLSGKEHGLTLHYRNGYLYSKEPATLKERFQQAVWQPTDENELTISTKVLPMGSGANIKMNIAPAGLDLEQQAERWMDTLDIFFIQRDDAGLHAQVEGQTLGLRLKPTTYQQLLSTGIPYEHAVQVKPGMASLRILVVDNNSGRMGSVTIPASTFNPDK